MRQLVTPPTVTRHAVEHREVVVVLCELWRPTASGQRRRRQRNLQIQFQTCLSRQLRGHNHHRLQWKAAIIQVGNELTVLDLVVTCLWRWAQAVEPTTKSHAPERSTMRASFQRDREGNPRRTVGQVRDLPNTSVGCPGCDGRSYRHLLKCQQKRIELGFSAIKQFT